MTAACDDNNSNNDNNDNEEEKCRFTTINKISSKIGKNAYKQKQTITEQRFRDEKKNTRSLNYARVQQQRGRERERTKELAVNASKGGSQAGNVM